MIAFITLFWSVSTAEAASAQSSTFAPEGSECGDPQLIAGTAGFRNTQEAIVRQANTYSASAFAARHLDRERSGDNDDWGGRFVVELNTTYGATKLPVFQPDAVNPSDVCSAANRVVSRGLDMQAGNFGLTVGKGRWSFLLSTSLTSAATASSDQFSRVLMNTVIAPPYVVGFSATAPLWDVVVPGPLDFGGVKLDWLAGARADLGPAQLSAAWLGSRGGYAQLSERTLGAYVFAAKSIGQPVIWQTGMDRFDPEALGLDAAIGLTSLRYEVIPTAVGLPSAPDGGGLSEAAAKASRLRVGGLSQQNLARVLDLAGRYRLAPDPAISELALGLHTPDYHRGRSADEDDEDAGKGALASGGMVSTPAAYAQGLAPATLPSARVELSGHNEDDTGRLAVIYNDPEQLQLYPFARGALSYQLTVAGTF
jgi:hypothetical protein